MMMMMMMIDDYDDDDDDDFMKLLKNSFNPFYKDTRKIYMKK